MADKNGISIRAAQLNDAAAITRIYNERIERRIATFQTRLRTAEDIVRWFGNPVHPVLVAELNDEGVGWVAASTYWARECYAGIAEFSVYIANTVQGKGIGSRLMKWFILACKTAGLWKLVSRIFPENTASRALCRKHGVRVFGVCLREIPTD
jgi:L-amino acid N-acyltransferase YncA